MVATKKTAPKRKKAAVKKITPQHWLDEIVLDTKKATPKQWLEEVVVESKKAVDKGRKAVAKKVAPKPKKVVAKKAVAKKTAPKPKKAIAR